MDLRPALQIQTIIKAMTDVVLPAVDPENKLAQEQARLVIGMLHLVAQRMPLMYRYDKDELGCLLALARELGPHAGGAAASDLNTCVAAGAEVLARAGAEPGELEAANFDVRERIGAVVTAIHAEHGGEALKSIGPIVTRHAREQLLRERAWLIAQGWEADPGALPSIEDLIGDRPSR